MTEKNTINMLSSADLPLMRALLNLFGDAFDDRETYCHHQPTDTYLNKHTLSP